MSRALALAITLVLAAACSSKPAEPAKARTKEEQRKVDSTIGASGLPGAGGVNKALAAQDSAAARAKQLDSLSKQP